MEFKSYELTPKKDVEGVVRVLVIDDDEDDFELIRCTLDEVMHCTYEITWTNTASRAIAFLQNSSVEICLCDYRIGGATGIDLIDQIRQNGCASPVVLVTGARQRDIDVAATMVGAVDFLEKDEITPERLERVIRYALAQHDRRRLEKEKEGAEEFSKLKSAFMAMISHELRTPLNAISGFAQLMLEENQSKPVSQQSYEYLGEIKNGADRLQYLIESILEFSDFAAGRLEICREYVKPCREIDHVLKELKKPIDEKEIVFEFNVDCVDHCILGDQSAIRKIFLNLISNAIKFSPSGSHIGLLCKNDKDGNLVFQVRDPGIGMSRTAVLQVYEPFQQGDQSLSRSFEGIGLGLPLVRALASLHDAEIGIDSQPERGTVVTVTFPEERIVESSSTSFDSYACGYCAGKSQ